MQWFVRSPGAISGRPLRYLLTTLLIEADRPVAVRELVAWCEREGVEFDGRPSKVISDALRWEIGWARVQRLGRGVYRAMRYLIPRSTQHWIKIRVRQLRDYLGAIRIRQQQAAVLSHPELRTGRLVQ